MTGSAYCAVDTRMVDDDLLIPPYVLSRSPGGYENLIPNKEPILIRKPADQRGGQVYSCSRQPDRSSFTDVLRPACFVAFRADQRARNRFKARSVLGATA